MRYGKKPTGGMWVMSVQLRQPPLCPGCCEELQGIVVEIRDGWAWCPICVASKLYRSTPVRHALAMDELRSHSTLQHGLRFYTPNLPAGTAQTAYEWFESSEGDHVLDVVEDEPDGVYVRLPGGVHSLPEVVGRIKELTQTVEEMRAVRERSR